MSRPVPATPVTRIHRTSKIENSHVVSGAVYVGLFGVRLMAHGINCYTQIRRHGN